MATYVWDSMEATAMPAVTGSVMRRYVSGAEMTVARIAFSEGAVTAEHRHENEQFSYVLEGTMQFTIEGAPLVVPAGEMVHLPSNVLHGAKAVTAAIVLDMFAPPRADWEASR